MSEEKNKNLDGFAHAIYNQFERPLKDSKKFKEQYKDLKVKIFFNITDATHTALMTIDKGTIDVRGILQSDKEGLKNAGEISDAQIKTDSRTFSSMNTMSTLKTIGKMISGKLKIKGAKYLKVLQDLTKLAEEEDASEFL